MPDKQGPDISDYIFLAVKDEGMSKTEIAERLSLMADATQRWVDPVFTARKNLFSFKDANQTLADAHNTPDAKMLFSEFWFEGELCILFADTNVGKSILAVQIGDAISCGASDDFIKVEGGPRKVVYFDFELTEKQFESRLKNVGLNGEVTHYRFKEDSFIRAFIDADTTDVEGFANFEEYLNHSLEQTVLATGAKVLIIDNITYLRDETENARNALPLMKYLKELKQKHGLSILTLAHTPKRDSSKPIGRNDLQGSKMLINFCDSSFAIGESNLDQGVRYLKQIKARNTAIVYHTENVLLGNITKDDAFLKFEFMGTGNERDHLKAASEKDRVALIEKAKEMNSRGMSLSEIAKTIGVSKATAGRYVNAN
jgi:RecA-family ATPase